MLPLSSHSTKDGHDEGNLEIKTNELGKATIDIIAQGSLVDVQVIADGFASFEKSYQVDEATREIQVVMLPPRAQISTYVDNSGKASQRQWGVQEPNHPSTPPVIQAPKPTNHTSDPDSLTPIDPNATPGNSQNQQTGPHPSGVPPQTVSLDPTGKPLVGKAVLVTGAAKRIGRTLALTLAEAGADVCITFRDSDIEGQATRNEMLARGVRAAAVFCDLSVPASVGQAVAQAEQELGRLDLLVNNAGAFDTGALESLSVEAWDAIFAANTRGPFLMAQACFPHLRRPVDGL